MSLDVKLADAPATFWWHPRYALRRELWHLDIIHAEHHDVPVRTTLTLEDDVARELELRRRQEGKSLKRLVNELLRRALRAGAKPLPPAKAVRIETFSSAFAPGIDVARLNQLNDELEIAEALPRRARDAP